MRTKQLFTTFFACMAALLSNCTDDVELTAAINDKSHQISTETQLKSTAKTILFSGYEWIVKDGTALGPGPNNWAAENVWVDETGKLHLRISFNPDTKTWECSSLKTTSSLGFGTYEWLVDGRIDQLDKNVVFGLFNYPTADIGPDRTNEIDIEYAQWGNQANHRGNYSVWPAQLVKRYTNWSVSFPVKLNGSYTTQRFKWSPESIVFQSFHGWNANDNMLIFTKTFSPRKSTATKYIPQKAEPLHINLWLFRGNAPSDLQPVEIVISKFRKY